ncbi:MAG: hypothetical protein HYW81_03290, partial [Parcubacteria group bacterium]|nr:hypothetical protein [Parcubacteria group bacterium]
NSAAVTSAGVGALTITATFSEPIATTPKIAINQQGTTDVSATNMSGSGTTWTYAYTVNLDDASAYRDGTATITISNAPDYAANALGTVTGNTFTIDTLVPGPAISTLAGASSGQTGANFSWTPTYTASDFSTYKFYWGTSTGITSANGTVISSATSGYSNLGTSSTGSLALSGLSAGANYYAVIYICDTAANCSSVSNEASVQTQQNAVITAPLSGGGSTGSTAPSTTSSSNSISSSGGSVTTTLASGSSAQVTVASGTFTSSTSITVSETTLAEGQSAPLSSSIGSFVGNSVFKIEAASGGTSVTQFSAPLTLTFGYTATQLGSTDPTKLSISYFDAASNSWVALASTVASATRTVTATTDHFTLFGLIAFVNPPASDTEDSTPPTQGQVLGSTVGVYPNGALLKAPSASAVWYISGDEKHLIRSAAIFESRFNWNDIINLPSSRQLDLYEQGPDVLFAAGTLVKETGNPAVYRVSANGGIAPIVSEDIFLGRGYSFVDVVEVESGFLATYPAIALVDDSNARYTGDLVKLAAKSAVYYLADNAARVIPSAAIFREHAFKFKNVRTVSQAQFDQFATGAALTYPDGTLVKGDSSAVYVVSDGKKRPILAGADFEALLYQWANIVYVPESLLSALPEASMLRLVIAEN